MKIITLEEHYADQRVMDAISAHNPKPLPEADENTKFFMMRSFPGEELMDFEKRLKFMDDNGITVQILAHTASPSDFVPTEEEIRICRMINDITKQHMEDYPGRFSGFATLPMADPAAAAAELERCVNELGFCGAMLAGRCKGRFFNEPEFFPVFEKAAELDVPVYFHPAAVPDEVKEAYYLSDAYSFIVGSELSTAGFGWHVETGIQVVRMILSGIFDKLPGLKFLSGHWGETIPAFLERMDAIFTKDLTGLKKNISEYYKEHVYLTPSGILSTDQLRYLIHLMGVDHILYAVDYPYVKPERISEFFADAGLTLAETEQIAYRNAERLLHL